MSFGMYAIQFYIQSSLPLLRRFLQVSLCYIPIRQLLDSLGVVQSFSKKGYPFDNACCECFFKYLKKEETSRRTYHTRQELHDSVFAYIEGFYNSRRPHASLDLLTPNEKEHLYWKQQEAATQIK